MKTRISLVLIGLILSLPALADHSLKDATEDSQEVAAAVSAEMAKNGVSCDLENSIQEEVPGRAPNSAWKQTASCTPSGSLEVSYTWENYRAAKLISIKFTR